MKTLIYSILILIIGFFENIKAQEIHQIQIDDTVREYSLYLPDELPENSPLVFVFHGYSGNAESTMENFGLNKIADKNNFAVCYPEGLIDNEGNHFWQVGYTFHKNIKADDVKFICTLSETLQKKYKLSKNNIFIIGFSNGGDLCNLLLCETSGVFKAAAPIISCIMKETYDACADSKAVPVFMLNGTHDAVTYWNGDMEDTQGYGAYLPSEMMFDFRIAQNNATFFAIDTIVSPYANDTTSVVIQKFINKNTNYQVWIYRVSNGGHGHPDYIDLGQDIWNFFAHYLNCNL